MGAAFGFIGAFAAVGNKTQLPMQFGWLYLFAICLLLWIGFACALRRVCRKYDLIKLEVDFIAICYVIRFNDGQILV